MIHGCMAIAQVFKKARMNAVATTGMAKKVLCTIVSSLCQSWIMRLPTIPRTGCFCEISSEENNVNLLVNSTALNCDWGIFCICRLYVKCGNGTMWWNVCHRGLNQFSLGITNSVLWNGGLADPLSKQRSWSWTWVELSHDLDDWH